MVILARGGLISFITRAIGGSDGEEGSGVYWFGIAIVAIIMLGFWAYKKNRDG